MFPQAIAQSIFLMLKCYIRGKIKQKMFKKIVSNLPFSPALIGQLNFYANRLRKEEITRKLGMVFVILTLVIQSLAVFQPPESANASSQFDMVEGGLSSINDFLSAYDNNTKNLRDVMDYVGITRNEVASATYSSFSVNSKKINWSFASRLSYAEGERQFEITDSDGNQVTTIYSRPLEASYSSGTALNAWIGQSSKMGWFAILQSCGNLETEKYPTIPTVTPTPTPEPTTEKEEPDEPRPEKCAVNSSLLASDERCEACPGNETIWIGSAICRSDIKKSKQAKNISQGYINATSTKAKPGDKISYTITISNTGNKSETLTPKDDLSDILEYAELIDDGGGSLDDSTKILSWSSIKLDENEKQTRTYIVRLLDPIPATAQGYSEPSSYDCIMTNVFGNSIKIKVECSTPKIVEEVTSQLPKTGPGENITFACILLATTTYFYMRSRQLGKEVRIIRKDATLGTI